MENILDMDLAELKNKFTGMGEPAFRASQIWNWAYKKFVFDFEMMSDLPKASRPALKERFSMMSLEKVSDLASGEGGTVKFLFRTQDDKYIESVLILAEEDEQGIPRMTLCVSCQAGCPLGCVFCATGKLGFERNLTAGEIIAQVLWSERYIKDNIGGTLGPETSRRISNIVFMGMGEPLLNYDAVLKAIAILNSQSGYNLGARHFTISTAGITPGILRLKQENLQIRLAVSLHAPTQDKREVLMPIARKYKLPDLIETIRDYQTGAERRVTFEYILLKGLNDSASDAEELRRLLAGLDYNLNLIAYNPVEGLPYETPDEKSIQAFLNQLRKMDIPFVMRRSKGSQIKAGCGQLGLYWKELGVNKS